MASGNTIVDKSKKVMGDEQFLKLLNPYRADTYLINENKLDYDNMDCEIAFPNKQNDQKMNEEVTIKKVSFEDEIVTAPPIYTEVKKTVKKTSTITEMEKFVNGVLEREGFGIRFDFKEKTYNILNKEVCLPYTNKFVEETSVYTEIPTAPELEQVIQVSDQKSYYDQGTKTWNVPKAFSGHYKITEKTLESILTANKGLGQMDPERMIYNAKISVEGLKIILKMKERDYKGVLSVLK